MLKSFLIDCTAREGSKDFLCEKEKKEKNTTGGRRHTLSNAMI